MAHFVVKENKGIVPGYPRKSRKLHYYFHRELIDEEIDSADDLQS